MAPVIIDNLHKYGIDFQTKVIAGLLTDKEFLERVSDIIDIEMFENAQHQWIVREILDYFIQYKEIPTMQVFKVRVDAIPDSRDDLKVGVIGSLRAVYLKVEETDLDFIRTQFLEFCKNQKLKKAIYDSIDHLKDGNYDQIRVAVDCALKAGMERNLGHNYKGDVEVRMSNTSREVVKTGWGVIDSLLDGGMGKGELFIGVAPSGIGKSWLLTRIGANAMIQGKNVMHFTLELNESYVGLRYDCCFSKINFQQIRNNKEKIANLMESIPGELNVKYYPVKTVSAQSLKYYIDRYVTLTGKKVDLVIVDYADLLKPIEADKNGSSYQDSGGIYEELRMIAGELGVPILTVSQTNRGGATEDIVQAHNIADSYKKIMTADFVFSLMRNLDDKANNTAKIHIIKNRFGPDGMTLYSKFNSGNGDISIYDDKAPEYIEIQQLANQSASNAKKFLKSKWDEINATKAGLDRET